MSKYARHSRLLSVLLFLLTGYIFVSFALFGPAATAAPPPELSLGLNLGMVADWSTDAAYVDAKAYFRRWGNIDKPWLADPGVKTDANRYPLSPAGAVTAFLGYPNGVYKLQYEGIADVQLQGAATMGPMRRVGDLTVADVILQHDPSGGGAVQLRVSPMNPNRPLANLRLISPGYAVDTKQIFRNEYLADVSRARVLRFMDPMAINNSFIRHWSDRTPPGAFYKTQYNDVPNAGIPYEDIIALCNATKSDAWVCIPDQADDDYVRQLADLLRDHLDPSLKVYVEWSNEIWNPMFEQYHRTVAAAKTNPQLTHNDEWGRAAEQVAFETVRVRKIFAAEYAARADAPKDAVRMVMCGQAANAWFLQTALEWMASHAGPPAGVIYGIGIAPYVGDPFTVPETDAPNLTLDSLFAALDAALKNKVPAWLDAHARLCGQYGVRLVGYEGGQHLIGDKNRAVKTAAQQDPRMGKLYRDLLALWKSKSGSAICLYDYCSPSSEYGYWGLKERATDVHTPKWDAFTETTAAWNGDRHSTPTSQPAR